MQTVAFAILVAAGMWLVWTGWLMLARPQRALAMLRMTAANHRINMTEQGLRALGGLALAIRAPESQFPLLFGVGGWFVVISSLGLMVVPLRWHAGYAVWWADRIPPLAVRAVGPVSALIGIGLIVAAL